MDERVKQESNFWKIAFLVLLAAVIVTANILVWYFFVQGKLATNTTASQTTTSPTSLSKDTIMPISSPTPTIEETALIKQAIFKLTGLNASLAEVTINKNTGTHATGGIKEFEAVGGAYFLAAKTATGWVGVYAGQAHPKCSEIAPYNFPVSLISECLDANNNVVKR